MDTLLDDPMPVPAVAPLDVNAVRADFPILRQTVYGQPLVYLDNGATAQKPQVVIDRIATYYAQENSNVHRGVHFLSQQATEAYEAVRSKVRAWIHAPEDRQVVFTRGTTEAINLVAQSYARPRLKPGDEVLISTMEHHSNIVPWQLVCEATGARLRVIPISDAGEIRYEAYEQLLSERTRLVALVHVSNTLGTINPLGRMIRDAHALGIPVLVDGAQALPHLRIDVQALDADFYCFSSHKMFGPTGIGILYGREALLESMPPWQGGGDMIETVSFERTTYNGLPHKFEAGTPNIADTVGFGAALDYLGGLDFAAVHQHEQDLLHYATERLRDLGGVQVIGTAVHKASVLSFVVEGVHPYDAGTILDRLGIAVRTGHHCTQPLMQRFGIPGTVRASFAFYNTRHEVDRLVAGVERVKQLFA
jgi:cysteine desulfurase/selenocysteine lyase